MQIFRLYELGPSDRVLAASHIFAEDDVEALRIARSRTLSLTSELWAGQRFIARMPPAVAITLASLNDRTPEADGPAADDVSPAAA